MTVADIAVIGGTGFYSFLHDAEEHAVITPYGDPSAPVASAPSPADVGVAPGDVVVPDQLVDRTHRRVTSYVARCAVHLPFADPLRRRDARSGTTGIGVRL